MSKYSNWIMYIPSCLIFWCFQGELCVMPSELDVQLEVERLSVRNFAHDLQLQEISMQESYDPSPPTSNESRDTQTTADSKAGRKKKNKYVSLMVSPDWVWMLENNTVFWVQTWILFIWLVDVDAEPTFDQSDARELRLCSQLF